MWTIQEIYNRQASWNQITGYVAEGEIKGNTQDCASGNLMDDNAGIRASRKKNKFGSRLGGGWVGREIRSVLDM